MGVKGVSVDEVERIDAFNTSGLNTESIAVKMGCSPTRIRKIKAQFGIRLAGGAGNGGSYSREKELLKEYERLHSPRPIVEAPYNPVGQPIRTGAFGELYMASLPGSEI